MIFPICSFKIEDDSTNDSTDDINMLSKYLVNKPRDEAPMTSLWISCLATSSAIAFSTSSDSITTSSTSTYIQNQVS